MAVCGCVYFTGVCLLCLFLSNVNLGMPKFSISAEARLDDTLKESGITDAFGDEADFSGMSDEVRLKVSKVGSLNVTSLFCPRHGLKCDLGSRVLVPPTGVSPGGAQRG